MKRLIYSPDVKAYVKTDGGIIDLSQYIVSGQVTRRVNQVSSAGLTIRNPDFRFTYDVERKKRTGEIYPVFHPMDPIFITMSRYADRETLVFTGYLDEVPYKQLYPGTCDITASCTLKKLQHTYFDPALSSTLAFMAKNGWQPSGPQGGLTKVLTTSEGKLTPEGSFASLLFETLIEIGGWDPNQVYIQPLPSGIIEVGEELYKTIAEENAKTREDVQELITGWIGSKAYGGGAGTVSGGPGGTDTSTTTPTPGCAKIIGTNFSKNAKIFAETFASLSGLNLKTVGAWMLAENPVGQPSTAAGRAGVANDQNWLNAGKTDTHNTSETRRGGYGEPASAAQLTCDFLMNDPAGYYDGIRAARGKGPEAECAAIMKSPWASSHYNGKLTSLLSQIKVSECKPEDRVDNQNDDKATIRSAASDFGFGANLGPNDTPDETTRSASRNGGSANPLPRNSKNRGKGTFIEGAARPGGSNIAANTLAFAKQLFELGYQCTSAKRSQPGSYHDIGQAVDWGDATNDIAALTEIVYPLRSQLAELWIPYGPKMGFYKKGVKGGTDNPDHIHIALAPGKTVNIGSGVTGDDTGGTNTGGGPRPVYVLGDSLGVGTEPFLQAALGSGWTITSKVLSGRTTGPTPPFGGLGILKEDNPGGTVVIALGTNDSDNATTFGERIDLAMSYVKPGAQVYWINISRGNILGNPHDALNTKLRQKAQQYNNLKIIDWRKLVKDGDVTLGDGVHTDPAGYKKRAKLIADALGRGGLGDFGGDGTSSSGTGDGSSIPVEDVKIIARAAAVSAYLEGPSLEEQLRADQLKGRKSMMNDKPLMPFVEEICSGSLRSFMSLPNGNFFAFYPDYFGSLGRVPYWEIDDVEILDGKIQLSDAALTTHVYVVGDIVGVADGINFLDEIGSAGVVTIFDAFNADFVSRRDFVNPSNELGDTYNGNTNFTTKKKKLSKEEKERLDDIGAAGAFLQRYGLRPKYIPSPMIRNPFYEMFSAYQKFQLLWSQQFLTQFSFTFMPELFPGGLVALTKHGLSLYVEEVTHSFDYVGGFQTSAQLSSPSALRDNDPERSRVSQGIIRPLGDLNDG